MPKSDDTTFKMPGLPLQQMKGAISKQKLEENYPVIIQNDLN